MYVLGLTFLVVILYEQVSCTALCPYALLWYAMPHFRFLCNREDIVKSRFQVILSPLGLQIDSLVWTYTKWKELVSSIWCPSSWRTCTSLDDVRAILHRGNGTLSAHLVVPWTSVTASVLRRCVV